MTLPLQRPAEGKGSPAHKRQQEKETQIQLEVKCCVGKNIVLQNKTFRNTHVQNNKKEYDSSHLGSHTHSIQRN